MKFGMISLGCAKNLVDSEMILGLFQENEAEIVSNIDQADVIIVNTCGFIDESKKESIETILEMSLYHKPLVVTGCLVQRYSELETLLPEVDLFIPIRDYYRFAELIRSLVAFKDFKGVMSPLKRVLTTPPYTAYLKISEGCNNRCHYCAIPLIRGDFQSFPMDDLLTQAKDLASRGIKELVVISQDTTRYGSDQEKKVDIVDLLKNLLTIKEFEFIRLLYLYPDEITDSLIELIAKEKRLTPYFDIPIQHASSKVLKDMNRRGDQQFLRELFKKIRAMVPQAILRTTLIVGYPSEEEEDFEELVSFIKEIEFDHLGVFTYSPEEGTIGATKKQIKSSIKKQRYRVLMEAQKEISKKKNRQRIGEIHHGIITGLNQKSNLYTLRSFFNAPDEIDGKIFVFSNKEHQLGDMVDVRITSSDTYDLFGEEI